MSLETISVECAVEGCRLITAARGWCPYHYNCWYRTGDPLGGRYPFPGMTFVERFWHRVDKNASGGCWVWTGGKSEGYGMARHDDGRHENAHRIAWRLLRGEPPRDRELDHLCRNRACCNPDHLEPVTHQVNIRRSPIAVGGINAAKTHCIRGHAFNESNTHVRPDGGRSCRPCKAARERARRAAKKGTL